MKKRKYTRNFDRLRETQGCLTDCVAYLFNIHPRSVPFFAYPRKGWNQRLKNFFKRQGFNADWYTYVPQRYKDGIYLVCGKSKNYKTFNHAVIYRGTKKVYDPNYTSPMKGEPTHMLVLNKIRK